jgi:hypothetical protein
MPMEEEESIPLLSLKADYHPDQISSYNCGDDCPPAPPLSTASDAYGWLCEEFPSRA